MLSCLDLTYNRDRPRQFLRSRSVQEKAKKNFVDSGGPSNGSGSATGRNRELRIAQIILAAQQTFREDGYAGFATRGVAGRVGITLGNLQYYFPVKEELLRTALQAYVQRKLDDYMKIAHRQDIDAAQRCSALVERMILDIHETDLPQFLFEMFAFSQHAIYAAELADEFHAQCRDLFARLFSEIQPALAKGDCLVRATVLLAQTTGMMIFNRYVGDGEKDYAEFVRLTKRSVKSLVELPPEALKGDVPDDGVRGRQRGIKQSAELGARVQGRLFNLSVGQARRDSLYYRPTVQGKRRELKINEIISCAANLLATEGYAQFTQARVARELGILPSALQNYFPTHDELLSSTIDALLRVYLERYKEMGKPSGKPALERLCEIVEDAFEEAVDPRVARFSFEIFALAQHSDGTRELVRSLYSAYRAIYVGLVREMDASATARDCLARATLIAAQMEGAAMLMFGTQKQAPDINRVFELMSAMTIRVAYGNVGKKGVT
ncbi:TetR family transcriptional regulator [Caballeronia megalochromosomata]|nr:TetR family transcriptional regulator [Caballeronia megalochromosomata]